MNFAGHFRKTSGTQRLARAVEELLIERQLILRLGKWKVRVVQVVDDSLFDCDLFRV